jgi:hypothetical protein
MKSLILLAALGLFASPASAEPRLARAFKNLPHPVVDDARMLTLGMPSGGRSDTQKLITTIVTPVKDQGDREDCSIFSATALLEAMIVRSGHASRRLDLSEEWLQYVATRGQKEDGSSSLQNFQALFDYGMLSEKTLPYVSESWTDAWGKPGVPALATERCDLLRGVSLQSCLIGHFKPSLLERPDAEFEPLVREAAEFRDRYFRSDSRGTAVETTTEAKRLLSLGIPLTLDLDFFIGAWNHGSVKKHGMPRDEEAYAHGRVGYPALGSKDRAVSKKLAEGHSILVVGYDDAETITQDTLMDDGTHRSITYKGVYYFKNSWGTEDLGREFEVDGKRFPGFAAITQKYAHEFGAFYRLGVSK